MRRRLPPSRPAPDRPVARDITRRQVSQPRQALIELGQFINYGWIEDLPVRDCEPVMDPRPTFYLHYKFESENGPREELALDDYVLKAKHVEMFTLFDRLKDGFIRRLEFKCGLPFDMDVRGPAA